jgi:hypothetical protein
MKEVALITLHGMGEVNPFYYSKLEKMLKSRLDDRWTKVSFQNVQYASILQESEDALWNSMIAAPKNKIKWRNIRKFFLFGFGDAGSLEHSALTDKKQYIAVQQEIQKAIDRALLDFDGDITKPIVIIAHSLGCQVISNYIWDTQKKSSPDDSEQSKFRALRTLTNLVTIGCNIPLFVAGLTNRKCFAKPNDSFLWDNFYDPDDVLGWPLRQLDITYDIVCDHPINSGGILSSWNPASHIDYWSDADIVYPLADILKSKMS